MAQYNKEKKDEKKIKEPPFFFQWDFIFLLLLLF